jgi:DNA-binding XRE family transcriptional regulator
MALTDTQHVDGALSPEDADGEASRSVGVVGNLSAPGRKLSGRSGMASAELDGSGHPRQVFGAMLRYYRCKAGMSQDQLGTLAYCSGDTIGKVEAGQRTPSYELAAACDAISELQTGGALTELRKQLSDILKVRAYPGWFVEWSRKESEASSLRWYEPLIFPGLLQTERYARAVLRTRVGDTDEQIEEMVAARMERQVILSREKPPTLWIVLDEGVLRRLIGSAQIMHDQLLHLATMASRPNVVIQVVPAATGAYEGLRGQFILASFDNGNPDVAYQDAAVFGQFLEDSADIAAVAAAWDTIKAEALPRSASLQLIEEIAGTWT